MYNNNGKTPDSAITPSELNTLARLTIENQLGSVWITGEVTDLYLAPSGHAYFSLKDSKSSVKCTFFKQFNFRKIQLKNGDNLLIFGKASLYEERGTFQIKVERVEKSGVGDMAKAFAELKVKLETLGYFSQETKKKIPPVINSLAIVTSQTSAAVTDILNVIKLRNPLLNVKIYHASVQGGRAVEEIIDALLTADINHHDAILLTRGGGSQEDLWTFNDISIAQTLFNLITPCVSAVGHERDTAITDLVADSFAITPTAAAVMLTPDMAELKLRLEHNMTSMFRLMQAKINNQSQQLDITYHKLEKSHPKNAIANEQQQLQNQLNKSQQLLIQSIHKHQANLAINENYFKYFDFNIVEKKTRLFSLANRMKKLVEVNFLNNETGLETIANTLNTLSPLSTLSRGYTITMKHKKTMTITNKEQVKTGDLIETTLKNGSIISQVTQLK